MKEWEAIFPEEERRVYEKAGYKGRQPFGRNPALLVIDVVLGFTGTKSMEILAGIDEFPTSCGTAAWEALPRIRELIDTCRKAEIPVVFSKGDPDFKSLMGNATKRAVTQTDREKLANEFPEMIKPREDEFVVSKARASAFFGTHLSTYLVGKGVDSVLVTGTTTSGCVRGTVLDAYSYGFPVFIVEECVFDRSRTSHLVNLFEMNAKYGNVITLAEALAAIKSLEGRAQRAAGAR